MPSPASGYRKEENEGRECGGIIGGAGSAAMADHRLWFSAQPRRAVAGPHSPWSPVAPTLPGRRPRRECPASALPPRRVLC